MPKFTRTSVVWNFFDMFEEGDVVKTKCKLCPHIAKYHHNTTNMKDHLKRNHAQQLHNYENQSTTENVSNSELAQSSSSSKYYQESVSNVNNKMNPIKKERKRRSHLQESEEDNTLFNKYLLRMIIMDYQPLSIVQMKGFQQFTKKLRPNYNLPSLMTLRNKLLPNAYKSAYSVIEYFVNASPHLSISPELWSTDISKYYITVTAHFIFEYNLKHYVLGTEKIKGLTNAENIAKTINGVLSRFPCLCNKVNVIVTDNTPIMKEAVTDYLKIPHHPCVAHILDSCVQNSITECNKLNSILVKCRALVTYFKQNYSAASRLKEYQSQMKLPSLKLKKDINKSWHSVFSMLHTFVEVQNPLSASLAELANVPEILDLTEWAVIEDVTLILTTVSKMMAELTAEQYPLVSSMLPLVGGLRNILRKRNLRTEVGISLRDSLLIEINFHLGPLETYMTIGKSTLLDPRFKVPGFEVLENANRAQCCLIQELSDCLELSSRETKSNEQSFAESSFNADPLNIMTIIENSFTNSGVKEEPLEDVTVSEDPFSNTTIKEVKTTKEEDDLWSFLDSKVTTETSSTTPYSMATAAVKRYLEMPHVNRKDDPLEFWKAHHNTFPFLSELALKYLCIPATSLPPKGIYNKSEMMLNQRRKKLHYSRLNETIFLNNNIDLLD